MPRRKITCNTLAADNSWLVDLTTIHQIKKMDLQQLPASYTSDTSEPCRNKMKGTSKPRKKGQIRTEDGQQLALSRYSPAR